MINELRFKGTFALFYFKSLWNVWSCCLILLLLYLFIRVFFNNWRLLFLQWYFFVDILFRCCWLFTFLLLFFLFSLFSLILLNTLFLMWRFWLSFFMNNIFDNFLLILYSRWFLMMRFINVSVQTTQKLTWTH